MKRALVCALLALSLPVFGGDWPESRGPARDGRSPEKNLPEKWSLAGENLLWKAPFGARSAPVVFGNHLYLQNGAGKGPTLQERLLCLDADTGKVLWEYHWNLYMSDVPPHRIAWASPAVDPETANVYTFGGNGTLTGLSKDGKVVWQRSLVEDYGLFTTHGGRTVSPIIDGDLVIISAIASTWGTLANRSHRILAFDKRTGATIWVSTPGGRPYDTSYSNPIIADVNGTRLLMTGLGDGSVVAVKPQTGEPVWRFEMAKRGINTAVVMAGNHAIVSHGDENLDVNVMGMIASLDATGKGTLGPTNLKWANKGFEAGYSSPIADGDRAYQVDNNANLESFDIETGRHLWKKSLGSIQKASLVMGDGKLYVGTESGKFYILKPRAETVDVLSEITMPISRTGLYSAGTPEPILAGSAIANGRVYIASADNLYCIGRKSAATASSKPAPLPKGEGPVAWVQVRPAEALLKPGESATFKAFSYDAKGRLLKEEQAAWSLDKLTGGLASGKFTAPSANQGQAGLVKATVGAVTGEARIRIAPAGDWSEDFDSMAPGTVTPNWVSAVAGKFSVAELEGNKVLAKAPDETIFRRMRVFFGPNDLHDYTLEADVRATERRRQMGDPGIFAQRYALILFGNNQRLELMPWQPETERTVSVPFPWTKDTWYRLKLRVENQPAGKVRTLAKAWKKGEPEPQQWLIDKIDPIGNREGSPGIFGDAQFGLFYDNLKVTANR